MAENAESVVEMSEKDEKTVEMIHNRLEILQKQRQELAARLEQETKLALMPLDSSIKELTWMLSQLTGQQVNPPEYSLFKRNPSQQQRQAPPQNVHQFQPAPRGAARGGDLPRPADVVESPKSGTPVPTNAGILKKALRKKP